jgi:hypothetical protein
VPVKFKLFNPSIIVFVTTPFTFDVTVFVFEAKDKLLLFIIVVVPTDPPIFDVIVLTAEFNAFETDKFVTARFVIVAFAMAEFGNVTEALDKSKFPVNITGPLFVVVPVFVCVPEFVVLPVITRFPF